MPEDDYLRLRVHAHGEIPVSDVSQLLTAIEYAYNSVYVFETIVNRYLQTRRHFPFQFDYPYWFDLDFFPRSRRLGRMRRATEYDLEPDNIRLSVLPRDQLTVQAVKLLSPGFWDFLGRTFSLEAVGKFLADRHERLKDVEYRKRTERERLDLENQLAQTKPWRERVALLKEMGVSERDLAPALNALVNRPLSALGQIQDRNLIGSAEIIGGGEKPTKAT